MTPACSPGIRTPPQPKNRSSDVSHCMIPHSTMSGPPETSSAAANVEYDVLFYKRALAGKVHRDKGIAKSDGCLTVDSVTGRAALRETCGNDENAIESENEDCNDQKAKKLSWNKRRALQQSNQKVRTSEKVVFAGIVRDFSQRALQIDDVISLGSYDVEIIALKQPSASATTGINHLARHTLKSVTPTSLSNRTMASVPLQSKRTGQVTTRVVNHSNVPLVSKREWPPAKPSAAAAKVPPKQPAAAPTTVNTTSTLPLKRKAPLATNIKAAETKGRQLADQLPESLDATICSTIGTNQAVGHIPLPASIRGALRPHQLDAVDFLWRRLNEKKGCILGDEMGLGVSESQIFPCHGRAARDVSQVLTLFVLATENAHDNCIPHGASSSESRKGTHARILCSKHVCEQCTHSLLPDHHMD
jgi:hypothetical protein